MATARVPLTSPAHLSAGRRSLFMAGVLLAIGAFVVTFLLGSFMVLRSQQIIGGVSVVVASRDIQAREALNSGSVQIVSYPSNLVPNGAMTGIAQANGKFAVRAIGKGEVFTPAMVSAQPVDANGAVQAFLPIPEGSVAFTIPTSELRGVGGYVAPGDYLDVIATVNSGMFGAKTPKLVTKTIITNLYVLRVGPQNPAGQSAATGVVSSLTVIINSCDAEMWSWMLAISATGDGSITLRYVLRSFQDYPKTSPSPGAGVSASPAPGASPATTSSTATTGSAASASPAPGQQPGTATAANACPLGGTSGISAAQVDARFGFSKI
jgi:Flp pilus assembly protein CpaB